MLEINKPSGGLNGGFTVYESYKKSSSRVIYQLLYLHEKFFIEFCIYLLYFTGLLEGMQKLLLFISWEKRLDLTI